MARIQSTANTFTIAAQKTLAATQRLVVEVAKREHAKVMDTDPRPSSFTRIVDGRKDAPEEAVKPNGVIVYTYPRLEEVVRFAMQTLFDLSPVLSGEYRNAHALFVNGQEVSNLASYRPGDDVAITNYVPYSRKIEVGKMKMRVPGSDRVYQQARRIVLARFGNMASIRFTFRGIVAGHQVNGASLPPNLKKRNRKGQYVAVGKQAHNQRDLRFPVLEISER
ncbi:hypothetical protein EOD08_15840 [Mesorhizobium sp. M6A.T.Ca.TU.002.02.2.1]|nr:hypothetical protein EOD08_15840 [Mesorhizobium sp. M6A.T.Ca.TU.002.02.2.1]